MAKHPHRLILLDRKTWRCTLPGCNFFVHLGLQHVLIGKTAICWECADQFILTAQSLQSDIPECESCRRRKAGLLPLDEMEKVIEQHDSIRASANTRNPSNEIPREDTDFNETELHEFWCASNRDGECDCGLEKD